MDGVLNVCKPRGMSSFQALSVVKRKLGLHKVGHLGTLDPAACGVLVLLCGRATKLANSLHAPEKTYRALFTWQKETDTLDDAGTVIATSDVRPTTEAIQKVLPEMLGDIEIEVPKYSAVHINGQRAYDLARQGIDFIPPKKTVHVSQFTLLPNATCEADLAAIGETCTVGDNSNYFEITCQSGTYVRSLAKLLAAKLGTVATASVILRTKVGAFNLSDAKGLNDVSLLDLQQIKEA